MDDTLCDELLQEIFQKLPPISSSSIPLVSKRWLSLYRASKTSLSLRLSLQNPAAAIALQSLSALLSLYPSLSSVSLTTTTTTGLSDQLLLSVSSLCPRLLSLRFMAGPVSLSSLVSLSRASNNLTSLSINLSRPLSLFWLANFHSLKELSISVSKTEPLGQTDPEENDGYAPGLGIESLSLSGIGNADRGLGWLWRSSAGKLRKLRLRGCEGIGGGGGDGGSFSSFTACLAGIREVEIRTCRAIVDVVLMKLAESCESLESLLVYDGGSREGLSSFFGRSRSRLRKLDLRLPLDLGNDHLRAVSASSSGATLSSLRLQSCCLVTGEGLGALGSAAGPGLEELALINCDAVEREPGMLANLGQRLRRLRRLDLSYNEALTDKEFASMVVSCTGLAELRLRGCRGLTGSAMASVAKTCRGLETVDVAQCGGIGPEAVESFFVNSRRLRRVSVEESKLSEAARNWAAMKSIEVD